MYKQNKLKKLGRKKSHRESLVRNQLRSLFENGKVQTTTPKAKVLKGNAESMINKAKNSKNPLSLRRELRITLGDKELIKKFMEYTAKENAGIRVVKTGFRSGDSAETSRVELLGLKKKATKKTESKKEEVKTEKKIDNKAMKNEIEKKNIGKSVSKKTVVAKTERAKSRSGL